MTITWVRVSSKASCPQLLVSIVYLVFLVSVQGLASEVSSGPIIKVAPDLGEWLPSAAKRFLGSFGDEHGGGTSLTILLGALPEAKELIDDAEVNSLNSTDAFIIRSKHWSSNSSERNGSTAITNAVVVACAGKTLRAVTFALYELLQRFGFAFLHPLKPIKPDKLLLAHRLDILETPRWEFRGTHYHTQHPLELTNLLNGYDSHAGTSDREAWAIALPAWEDYLDWMLAQKQMYVEWMLLGDTKVNPEPHLRGSESPGFEWSEARCERLRNLTTYAHARGLEVGADVPLTLRQQHALSLLSAKTAGAWWDHDSRAEVEVRTNIEWLLQCGFDHVGTELGTTEFTKGLPASELVRLLNVVQETLGPKRKLLVKNHCSTGQVADGFADPRPSHEGETLNFNYVSYYADSKVVSMPHTVQAYSLKDKAPTYGNKDFSDLKDWTKFLLEKGRPMVFYPETSYWVNYDISVPLFLAPTYASDRLEDAETIDAMPGKSLGQLNFESGFQFGYWLANSAQALIAWQKPESESRSLFQVFWKLLHFTGPTDADETGLRGRLSQLLVESAEEQRRLLVRGDRREGSELITTEPGPGLGLGSATGMAYLQGSEGLSDLASLVSRYLQKGAPQPDRLLFSDLWHEAPVMIFRMLRAATGGSEAVVDSLLGSRRNVVNRYHWYKDQLRPLLYDMNVTFSHLAEQFQELPTAATEAVNDAVQDLVVSAKLLSLRSTQVLALYDHAADCGKHPIEGTSTHCALLLEQARRSLTAAHSLVAERTSHFGLERLGGNGEKLVLEWGSPAPTAYSYGYLWAARQLFYWQRDQAIVEKRISDPCFGTINDPTELGLEGGGPRSIRWIASSLQRLLDNGLWQVALSECIGPKEEPTPFIKFHSDCKSGCAETTYRFQAGNNSRIVDTFALLVESELQGFRDTL